MGDMIVVANIWHSQCRFCLKDYGDQMDNAYRGIDTPAYCECGHELKYSMFETVRNEKGEWSKPVFVRYIETETIRLPL